MSSKNAGALADDLGSDVRWRHERKEHRNVSRNAHACGLVVLQAQVADESFCFRNEYDKA